MQSTNLRTAFVVAACVAMWQVWSTSAQGPGPRVEITVPNARAEATTGMVYVAFSRDNKRTPIEQAGPTGAPLLDAIDALQSGRPVAITSAQRGRPIRAPRRHAGGRLLGAAVRQRLHAVRAPTARRSGFTWTSGRGRTGSDRPGTSTAIRCGSPSIRAPARRSGWSRTR